MTDLKQINVSELDRFEMNLVNGGITGLEVIGLIAAVVTVYQVIDYAAEQALHGWNNPR